MSASYDESELAASSPFARARQIFESIGQELSGSDLLEAEHGVVEERLVVRCKELMRQLLQDHLDLRSAREESVDVVDSAGVERRQVRECRRGLETVFGRVKFDRLLYQAAGRSALSPADAELNLPVELYSHGVRRLVANEVARASYDEVLALLKAHTAASVGKRQVEELVARAAEDFDAFYEERRYDPQPGSDDALMVISTDAKGIFVRRQDLRAKTRQRAETVAPKLATRLTPGEKRNRKRMAQVASVYEVEPSPRTAEETISGQWQRPSPQRKRVWASIEKPMNSLVREAFDEALRRDPERRRRWVVLVDGDPRQLTAIKAQARRVGVQVTIIIDVVHVLEYLWLAGRALFGGSTPAAELWVGKRFRSLLEGRRGGDIARTIRYWADRNADTLTEAGRQAVREACRYLTNRTRTRHMKYGEAIREGLPIATGIIEGACRYLIKDRMDRTGARWSLRGAEAVLRLRALCASKHFDGYWKFHVARERQRNHEAKYARGEPPNPSHRPHLRLAA